MAKPSVLEQRINTLKEFYTDTELGRYYDMILDYRFSFTKSLKYLEEETIKKYRITNQKPNIGEYIKTYTALKIGKITHQE